MVFVYVVKQLVHIILIVLEFAMLARAVMSWLPVGGEGRIAEFLYMITEPVIVPARRLLSRFDSLSGLPLDIPFFVTFVIISLLSAFI
ncbi:MAG: YggT family protein [Clostridia bacterium]|nr:YggT family protein [Clostridia bacterium]MBP5236995.1 YggT family protein [Clostridia bacterium]